jgi:hypothetical protein
MAWMRAEAGVPKIVIPGDTEPRDWIGPWSYMQTNPSLKVLKKNPHERIEMNLYSCGRKLVSLACACVVLVGCANNQAGPSRSSAGRAAAASSKDGGHLIVTRIANFGTNLDLLLSVDGAPLATVVDGQNYDGYLPPGRHVLSAIAEPNGTGQTPTKVIVTIQKGVTYSYTARWKGETLVLVKN